MNQLEQIVEKIEGVSKRAAMSPEDCRGPAAAGLAVAVTQAKEKLAEYKVEYREAVLKNGVAIFVSGNADAVRKFGEAARESGEAIVVDAHQIYKNLATIVNQSFGADSTRQFTSTQAMKLNEVFAALVRDLEMPSVGRGLQYGHMPLVPTFDSLVAYIHEVVRSSIGDTANRFFVANAVSGKALEIRYKGNVTPVVLTGALPEEVDSLGTLFGRGKGVVVLKDEIITKEFVVSAFKDIYKQIKNRK